MISRILCFAGLLLALLPSVFAGTLHVAVAANMQYAFDDLRDEFKKTTGHDLLPTYNSSGKFTAQIMHGAPFDVFLSADMIYPEKLHQAGLTTEAPKIYAYGALVLWTMKDADLTHWQRTLASAAIDKIAIANPKTAPYGSEAMKALAYYRLEQAVTSKLVFGESIAQTTQYIHSGAADIGITAKSIVLAPGLKGQGRWVDIPKESYTPIAQGAAILQYGKKNNPQVAQQFYDFLFSPTARKVFERYGYALP